jgi:hypothetical protein
MVQTYTLEGGLSRKSLEESYAYAIASVRVGMFSFHWPPNIGHLSFLLQVPNSPSKAKVKVEARKILNGDLELGMNIVKKMTSYARWLVMWSS